MPWADTKARPLALEVQQPPAGSAFVQWHIQTVRQRMEDEDVEPMLDGDDPYDPEFQPAVVALYGVDALGCAELVRHARTYAEVRSLAMKLAPGVLFPEGPVVRMRDDG